MKILATFINFASDPEVVELVHAWDEFALDNNYSGYEDSKQEALAEYGDDVLNRVTVTINVPDQAIYDALIPNIEINGSVETPAV